MDYLVHFADSIKTTPSGHVSGYLVRYGDPTKTDLEGDYFTKSTDFGFPAGQDVTVPLNLYYHHGMDETIGKRPIGKGYVKGDETGLWYTAQLEMADEYGQMIAKLASEGKMGFSSGAAGHLVERVMKSSNTHEVIRWPIAEASMTPTPAESRNIVQSLKSLYEKSMDYMESESPDIPIVEGVTPQLYAKQVYADITQEVTMEGLESLYEKMCTCLCDLPDSADKTGYSVALIDEFAGLAKSFVTTMNSQGILMKSTTQIESLRTLERKLRDAVGLSRTEAKRFAPSIWETLRDAEPEVPTAPETPVIEVKTEDRQALITRLEALSTL
jgi:hypothetical protein